MNEAVEASRRVTPEEIRIPTSRQNIRNNALALFYHQVLPNISDALRAELNNISQDGTRSFSEVVSDRTSAKRLMQSFQRFERENPDIEKSAGNWYDLDIVSAVQQFLQAKKEGKITHQEVQLFLQGEAVGPDANLDTILSRFQEKGLPLEGLRELFHESIVDPRSQIEQERQSGNPKVQGVIEAVANSVDAIAGSKDTIGQFGIGVKQLLTCLDHISDDLYVVSKTDTDSTYHAVQLKRGANGKIFLHFLTNQELSSLREKDPVSFPEGNHGTSITIRKEKGIESNFAEETKDKIREQAFPFTQGVSVALEGELINGHETKRAIIGKQKNILPQGRVDVTFTPHQIQVKDNGIGMNLNTLSRMFSSYQGTKPKAEITAEQEIAEKEKLSFMVDSALSDNQVSFTRNQRGIVTYDISGRLGLFEGGVSIELGKLAKVGYGWEGIIFNDTWEDGMRDLLEKAASAEDLSVEDKIKTFNTIFAVVDKISAEQQEDATNFALAQEIKKFGYSVFQYQILPQVQHEGYTMIPNFKEFSKINPEAAKSIFIDPYLVDWKERDFEGLGCHKLKTDSSGGYVVYSVTFYDNRVVKGFDHTEPKAWLENTDRQPVVRFGDYIFVDSSLTKKYSELIAKPEVERTTEEVKKVAELKQLLEIVVNPYLITDYEIEKDTYPIRFSTHAEVQKAAVDTVVRTESVEDDSTWRDFLGGEKSFGLTRIEPPLQDTEGTFGERVGHVEVTPDERIMILDHIHRYCYVREKNGNSWVRLVAPEDRSFSEEVFSPDKNTFLFISSWSGDLLYTTDQGKTWHEKENFFKKGSSTRNRPQFVFLPDGKTLISDMYGYVYAFDGKVFTEISPGTQEKFIEGLERRNGTNTLFAYGKTGVWFSFDHGRTWNADSQNTVYERKIIQSKNGDLLMWEQEVKDGPKKIFLNSGNWTSEISYLKFEDDLGRESEWNVSDMEEAIFTDDGEIIFHSRNRVTAGTVEPKARIKGSLDLDFEAYSDIASLAPLSGSGFVVLGRNHRIYAVDAHSTDTIMGQVVEFPDLPFDTVYNILPHGLLYPSSSEGNYLYSLTDPERARKIQQIRPGLIARSKQTNRVMFEKLSQIPVFEEKDRGFFELCIKNYLEQQVEDALEKNPEAVSENSIFLPDHLMQLFQDLDPKSPFMKKLMKLQVDVRDMDKGDEGILTNVARFGGKIFRKKAEQQSHSRSSGEESRLKHTLTYNLIKLVYETNGQVDFNSLNLEALSMILLADNFGSKVTVKEAYDITNELLEYIDSRKETRLSYKTKDSIVRKMGQFYRRSTPENRRTFIEQFKKCQDPKIYQKVVQSLEALDHNQFSRMVEGESPNWGGMEVNPQAVAYASFIINKTEVLPTFRSPEIQGNVLFEGQIPLEAVNYLFSVYRPSSMAELLRLYQEKKPELEGTNLEQIRLRIMKEIEAQANEPGVWTREAVQNAVKAIRARNAVGIDKASEGRIDILNFVEENQQSKEKWYVEEIRDNGAGVPDYLYLLVPGLSTAQKGQEQIGYFGAGFFTLFDGADKIQVQTNYGNQSLAIEMEVVTDENNEHHIALTKLSRIDRVDGKKLPQGTTVRRMKKVTPDALPELENMVTKANVLMFAGLVSGKTLDGVPIHLNIGRQDKDQFVLDRVDLKATEEASTPFTVEEVNLGNLQIISSKKTAPQVATNLGLRMSAFSRKYYELIPPQIRQVIDEYSLSLLLPQELSLTKDRSSIAHEERLLEPLAISVSQEMLKLTARKILEDNLRIQGYPEDYLSNTDYAFSYTSETGKRIQAMADKINKNQRVDKEDLEFVFERDDETDKDSRLARLIVLLEFPTGGTTTSLLLERLKVQKQAGILEQAELQSHRINEARIGAASILSTKALSSWVQQAKSIVQAKKSMMDPDTVPAEEMSPVEQELVRRAQLFSKVIGIDEIRLSREIKAAGIFNLSRTAYLLASLAALDPSAQTRVIVHELAHGLEARMEDRAYYGHDASFTHQQHGKFAESMRFIAQLALRVA